MTPQPDPIASDGSPPIDPDNHFRFHLPHLHLSSAFGAGWFGGKAEGFARFFGTPIFLALQTAIVIVWIVLNAMGVFGFDPYPFILLNLGFSLQAAYAAPMILLAQTRQADRDKANAEADARHREDLALASERRQEAAAEQAAQMLTLIEQNTRLTETVRDLSEHIQVLTVEMHRRSCVDIDRKCD